MLQRRDQRITAHGAAASTYCANAWYPSCGPVPRRVVFSFALDGSLPDSGLALQLTHPHRLPQLPLLPLRRPPCLVQPRSSPSLCWPPRRALPPQPRLRTALLRRRRAPVRRRRARVLFSRPAPAPLHHPGPVPCRRQARVLFRRRARAPLLRPAPVLRRLRAPRRRRARVLLLRPAPAPPRLSRPALSLRPPPPPPCPSFPPR